MIYRQVSHILRIHRPGKAQLVSARPREGGRGEWGRYLDSDAQPTLIELDGSEQVDLALLLAIGAIVPYTPARKEVKHG